MTGTVMKPWACSAALIVLAATLSGCGSSDPSSGKKPAGKNPSPVSAQVLKMQPKPLTLDKNYPALLRSNQQVQVVARITGFLSAQHYKPGAYVKKGQKLFTIQPAPYRAQLEQKQANLASARATEKNAQRNWDRTSTLYQRSADSKQTRDQALSKLKTAKASVKQAKAALDASQINYNYTSVTAPVAGEIGLRNVNVGGLVQASTKLVTITPFNPLRARFSMPVADASALRAQRKRKHAPRVIATLITDAGRTLKGKVDFLSVEVNNQTSTVQARATFDNPKHLVSPGQYVQISLLHLQLPHILAVPQGAVTQGQEGAQVYTLDKHNKVKPVSVDLGTITGNHWIVVNGGLKPGDRVVVNRIAKISAGSKIKPHPYKGNRGGGNPQKKGARDNHRTARAPLRAARTHKFAAVRTPRLRLSGDLGLTRVDAGLHTAKAQTD